MFDCHFLNNTAYQGVDGSHRTTTDTLVGGSVLFGQELPGLTIRGTDIQDYDNRASMLLSDTQQIYCRDLPCELGFSCSYDKASLWCTPCPYPLVSTDGISCTQCSASQGPSSDRSRCEPCPDGLKSIAGVCERCLPGHQPDTKQVECLHCSEQKVSVNGTLCTRCPDGAQPNPLRSACVPCSNSTEVFENTTRRCICKAGMERKGTACTSCSPDRFKPQASTDLHLEDGTEIEELCKPCPNGAISDSTRTKCVCPVNFYNVSYGKITCYDKAEEIKLAEYEAQTDIAELQVCQSCDTLECIDCSQKSLHEVWSHVTVKKGYGLPSLLLENFQGLQAGPVAPHACRGD